MLLWPLKRQKEDDNIYVCKIKKKKYFAQAISFWEFEG